MKRLLVIGCAIALTACTTDNEESSPYDVAPDGLEQAASTVKPVTVPAPAKNSAEANEAEREAKRQWNAAPNSRVEEIDWPAANGYPRIDLATLPESERSKISEIPLPVMLPDDPEILETAIITRGDNWYAASLKGDGVSLHVRGTRVSFDFEEDVWSKAEKSIGDNYTLTRTHQIVTVAFGSFGAAYTVDVECSKPMDDIRCTDDAYALDLANDLAVAGGLR